MKVLRSAIAIAGLVASGMLTSATAPAGAAAPGSPPAHAANRPCPLPTFGPGRDYHPRIHPSSFSAHLTNPWFGMRQGNEYVYEGVDGKDRTIDIVIPSRHTRKIDGVDTRGVYDLVFVHGRISERTTDYYAQDRCGNVWYFGENTAELNRHGKVKSRAGSFLAGVDGAEPGVIMQAQPQIGREFRQEWKPGKAEDRYVAVGRHASVQGPAGSFHHVLKTKEADGLEPGVREHKFYAFGVGDVKEDTYKGAHESLRLVEILR
jgi:hypothetical protein